jgi:two-component system, chemotaxis family, CheB/CheR fusion protein
MSPRRRESDESRVPDPSKSDRSPPETEVSNAYVTPPFLVAAVGASAGGLLAFSSLLGAIPRVARLAVVLVQHMSRSAPSLLPEILATRTELEVVLARDEVEIEQGYVYVIAPDTHMTVIDGHLRVRPRPEGYGSAQVNALFASVAEYYRERSVGVILSGALSDGSDGFRAIKAVGGITFAQEPEEAQTESMPRAAIATGDVDQILSAQEIAQELVRLSQLPPFKPAG